MRNIKTSHKNVKLSLLTAALLLSLSACNGDDGADGTNGMDGALGSPGEPGTPGQDGSPGFASASFFIANNGDVNRNTVSTVDQNANELARVMTGANEGLVYTQSGRLVQAGDSDMPLLRSLCNFDGTSDYSMSVGHQITGQIPVWSTLKELALHKRRD